MEELVITGVVADQYREPFGQLLLVGWMGKNESDRIKISGFHRLS